MKKARNPNSRAFPISYSQVSMAGGVDLSALINNEQISAVKQLVCEGRAIPAIIVGCLIDRLELAEGRIFRVDNYNTLSAVELPQSFS